MFCFLFQQLKYIVRLIEIDGSNRQYFLSGTGLNEGKLESVVLRDPFSIKSHGKFVVVSYIALYRLAPQY